MLVRLVTVHELVEAACLDTLAQHVIEHRALHGVDQKGALLSIDAHDHLLGGAALAAHVQRATVVPKVPRPVVERGAEVAAIIRRARQAHQFAVVVAWLAEHGAEQLLILAQQQHPAEVVVVLPRTESLLAKVVGDARCD